MKLLSPTPFSRLNEIAGFLLLSLGLVVLLSLASYHVQDPSWDTATDARPLNLVGYPGAYLADLLLQSFGAAALLLPFGLFLLSWKWIRSEEFQAGGVKVFGFGLLLLAVSSGVSFLPISAFFGNIPLGGVKLMLSSWEVGAFLKNADETTETLQRAVAARAVIAAQIERRKRGEIPLDLPQVIKMAQHESGRITAISTVTGFPVTSATPMFVR